MRLLIISSEFRPGPGGIGTHAYELARALNSLGWDITVMSPQGFAAKIEIDEFNGKQPFKIINLRPRPQNKIFEIIGRFFGVFSYALRWKPDLAVATGGQSVWLSALIFPLLKIPWAAIGHGGEFGVTDYIEKLLMRRAFNAANGAVCVSHYTAAKMHEMGIHLPLEEVIPNGADPLQFPLISEEDKKRLRLKKFPDAEAILLTVGSVSNRKGQDTVIKALSGIHKVFPKTHYVLAGFPQEKEAYFKTAKDLGVEKHVHFLGCVNHQELIELINICDIYILTSRHSPEGDFEGYGISVVEAAFCGKPAVVTRDSGLVEAIVETKTGLAIPQNDEKAAARAVIELLSNPAERLKMGMAARQRAVGSQTWEKLVVRYDGFLKKVADSKRK